MFPPHHVDESDPEDRYARTTGKIEETTLGVKVGGVGFDTQSGYSEHVSVRYVFSKRKLRYYLCGIGGSIDPDGQPKPETWSQLWAGA